ncbi:MAG: AAA family ATPase [Alphaproteobacteria bacterium]|nr:AAA family ATPase [Alphaproteobacteria bacterium]
MNSQPSITNFDWSSAISGEPAWPEAPLPRRRLVPITAAELLTRKLPPRKMLLDPVLCERSLVMLYAPRGIGKTFVALSIAYAVASGGTALGWKAPTARRVVYIDGEMPAADLQDRLQRIGLGSATQLPSVDRLRFICADLDPESLPNIATEEGQRLFTEAAADSDLIVLDNLSSLASGLRENEADDWGPVQKWLLSLRRTGKTVLLVHHANKSGGQRGTSRREHVLDVVIALHRPEDYDPEDGAVFVASLEKARGIVGDAARPFEARLVETPEGGLQWQIARPSGKRDRAIELLASGKSVRKVAKETGISKSTVQRLSASQGHEDAH